eukprot:Skav227030  [mRNA]  locus=scaffold6915:159:1182:+ [translate_table: standard]
MIHLHRPQLLAAETEQLLAAETEASNSALCVWTLVPIGDSLRVYVGGRVNQLPANTAVLNCVDEQPAEVDKEWCYNPNYFGSVGGSPAQRLRVALRFVKKAVAEGKHIFVHCKSGVHRAPSVVAVLAMMELGLSYEDGESWQQ